MNSVLDYLQSEEAAAAIKELLRSWDLKLAEPPEPSDFPPSQPSQDPLPIPGPPQGLSQGLGTQSVGLEPLLGLSQDLSRGFSQDPSQGLTQAGGVRPPPSRRKKRRVVEGFS